MLAKPCVVGQEAIAPAFDGNGKMEGVLEPEVLSSPDVRRPLGYDGNRAAALVWNVPMWSKR